MLNATRDEIECVIKVVCWRAKVKPPKLSWSGRNVRGCYYPTDQRVCLGPEMRNGGNVAATMHELAHHVVHMRAPRLTKREQRRYPGLHRYSGDYFRGWTRSQKVSHGLVFVDTLKELATLWYGDVSLYPWDHEYRSLRGEGKKKLDSVADDA